MPDYELPDSSSLESDQIESISVSNGGLPPSGSRPKLTIVYVSLAVLGLIILIALGTMLLTKKPATPKQPAVAPITINTQTLDNGVLTKIANQVAPNQAKPQLTVDPDTLFKKDVAINGAFTANNAATIGNNLNVGGNLNTKGTSTLQGAVGINSNLAVRGALSVGGALSAGSLNVGSLIVTTVNASGNLNFGGHLVASGATPSAAGSAGTAGGTVTVDGNDTAGTIVITTGSGNQVAGEMAIITFKAKFAGTPKVQLTPIDPAAAGLTFYATRSAGFFTINSSSVPVAGTTYTFDYLVTQ